MKSTTPSLVILVGLALLAAGCKGKSADQDDAPAPQIVQKSGQQYLSFTPDAASAAESTLAKEVQLPGVLETTGQVIFDDKKVTTITSRVQGRVEDVRVSLWDNVNMGDPILKIYSPEFMLAEEEYVQAQKSRQLNGGFEDVSEMMYAAAKRKLTLLGMSESDIVAISSPTTTIWMRAPLSGTILQNQTAIGNNVNVGDTLYQLGTLDKVWITADIYEIDLARVQVGQELDAVTEAFPDDVFKGKISRISPVIDPNKQTAQIKCEVENPGLKLKPQMLARVKITTRPGYALVVPQQALVYDGDGYYAFVQFAPDLFERRAVQIGSWNKEGYARVLSGLKRGERVMTQSLQFNALWHQARGESY